MSLRTPASPPKWAVGRAPDAEHRPLSSFDPTTIPESTTIYCVCRSGRRSADATERLRASTRLKHAQRPQTIRRAPCASPGHRKHFEPGTNSEVFSQVFSNPRPRPRWAGRIVSGVGVW